MASSAEWASALWGFYYPVSTRMAPAYLSMDDEELLAVGTVLGLPSEIQAIRKDLVNCVLDDLQLTQSAPLVLARIVARTRSWASSNRSIRPDGETEAPPQLPFLALTVLAARELGSDRESSIAFYRKLRTVLGVREEFQEKLQKAYTKEIEFFWGSLNSALVELKYKRGVPTASSLTQRYASIPVSQSVIRVRDRKNLVEFFMDTDLKPDSIPSLSELEQLFEWWLKRGSHSISANLEALWRRGKVERGHVLEVIANELENWDGSIPEDQGSLRNNDSVKLILQRDKDWFGNESISVALAFQTASMNSDDISLESTSGQDNLTAHRLGFSKFFQIPMSPDSTPLEVLAAETAFRSEVVGEIRKTAKSIYVLKFDPELQLFIEGGKPTLGEPVLVLCSRQLGIAEKVREVLSKHASESTSEVDPASHGLDGWSLFQDVRFEYPFEHTRELAPLTTNSNAALFFVGGLKLGEEPGVRVWSRHFLPTVEVIIPEGSVIKLKLEGQNGSAHEDNNHSKSGFGRVQFNLQEEQLEDGEYLLKAEIGSDKPQVLSRKFVVRSDRSPRPSPFGTNQLLGFSKNNPSKPEWLAEELAWSAFPQGPLGEPVPSNPVQIPQEASWPSARGKHQNRRPKQRSKAAVLTSSCSFSGAHVWDLGTCAGEQKYVEAVCRNCQSRRREACKHYLVNKDRLEAVSPVVPRFREVPLEIELAPSFAGLESERAYPLHKSLGYLKAGIYKEIKEAAASLGLDGLATRRFTRWLEASGSIEIENQHDEEAAWSLNPSTLVETKSGSFRVVGNLPSSSLANLKSQLGPEKVKEFRSSVGYEVWISDVEFKKLSAVAEELNLNLVQHPHEILVSWVRPLSEAIETYHLSPIPDGKGIEKFNTKSSDWEPLGHGRVDGVGAFRVQGPFSKSVFFVPEIGLSSNQGYKLDAVLAKHLACFFEGGPLVSYSQEKEALYLPLGMELPGLLGRLAVSCSGKRPVETRKTFASGKMTVLRYDSIDKDTAGTIYRCLGGQK